MILVLFRHGHKGLIPFQNPDLTPKGFDQALNLVQQIDEGLLPEPTHCWFSELIRTQQTLFKAIEKYKPQTFQKSELNVRSINETPRIFHSRIQKFLSDLFLIQKMNQVHFICTHYDWIEEVLNLITTDKNINSFEFTNWSPGQYLAFEVQSTEKNEVWKVLKQGVLV